MDETPFRPTVAGVLNIFEEAEALYAEGSLAFTEALSQQFSAREKLTSLNRDLVTREAELVASGKATGKNAEERKASITAQLHHDAEFLRLVKEQQRWQAIHDQGTLAFERAKGRMAAGRARSSFCIQLLAVMAGSSTHQEAGAPAS